MNFTVKQFIDLLLKRVGVLLAFIAFGLTLAFVVSKFILPPMYVSRTSLYVSGNTNASNQDGTLAQINYSERLTQVYMVVLQSNSFLKQVADTSGLGYSASQIKGMMKLTPINSTQVFEILITGKKPTDSSKIAQTIAQLAPDEFARVVESGTVRVVDAAETPTAPSSPNILNNTILGGILGLAVAIGVVFLVEILDVRIKTEDDIKNRYNVPVLGVVPIIQGSAPGGKK